MQIVCPHCETSYTVEPKTLGPTGRNVRCVRCRETWHARVDDMERANALVEAVEEIGWATDEKTVPAKEPTAAVASAETVQGDDVPHIQSPPIAHEEPRVDAEWAAAARSEIDLQAEKRPAKASRLALPKFRFAARPVPSLRINPNIAITAMAALVLALIVWRNDVVRLMPQTASFFQLTGLGVNLRNMTFEDVRVTSETVNGSRIFVIEGAIAGTARKPLEVPRLRFVVQDAKGTDIYAWNAVVDQAILNPGDKIAFRSRLASPPAEAHNIVVRFFHRRDLASGSV